MRTSVGLGHLLRGMRAGILNATRLTRSCSYVNNFFYKIRDLEVHPNTDSTGSEDEKIRKSLHGAQDKVHNALADSFNTAVAMQTISNLVTDYNSADKAGISDEVSFEVGRWITVCGILS